VFLTTTVEVSDDNCHHKSLITVSKISSDLLSLNIESGCEHIKKAAASIGQNLNRMAVTATFDRNIVYEKVAEAMPGCVVCAVPCAIVKASWTELGMNLRKDAHIQFV
jgi:predicted transcriptional regulator